MSVITASAIQQRRLRTLPSCCVPIPGVNMTQVSARDINVTSRAATGTLATGLLALLDGRSLYQDMFGFVMWDFLPVNLNEIKQIEVIRGPASAVWGANALYGVVNVITKSPREMQGTSATFGIGVVRAAPTARIRRRSGTSAAPTRRRSTIAGPSSCRPARIRRIRCRVRPARFPAIGRKCARFPRPPIRPTRTPARRNPSSTLAWTTTIPDGAKFSFTGGVAGTDGMMHSGIGPFDIQSGTVMGYGKVNYSKKALRASFFTNIFHGDANNLLARNPLNGDSSPSRSIPGPTTSSCRTPARIGTRHVLNYGGNLRFNTFDLEIAPQADNRTEFGVYAQDEMFLSDHFRWTVGARLDRFDYLNDVRVFAADGVPDQAAGEPDDSSLLQSGLPGAIGD